MQVRTIKDPRRFLVMQEVHFKREALVYKSVDGGKRCQRNVLGGGLRLEEAGTAAEFFKMKELGQVEE